MKVLGMGNALTDVLALVADDKILDNLSLPKGSMQLIDEEKFKILSEEINKLNPSIVSGGSAANTIVGLANLGIQTGFLGRIGKDVFGQYYKNDLLKCAVKSHLTEVNETSGVATTFISKDGQRTFGTYLGAAALLDANELKQEDFEGYDYFYIEGYLVQNLDLIRTAMMMAKKSGAKIILDLASYNVVEQNKDFLQKVIPQYVDIIFANEEEAAAFLGKSAEEVVSILAKEVDIAIVKVGKKGSWVQRGDEKVFQPAYTVDCIDTTGAGDLYASGFLYGLINNYSLSTSAKLGNFLASQVIQHIGPKIKESDWDFIRTSMKEIEM